MTLLPCRTVVEVGRLRSGPDVCCDDTPADQLEKTFTVVVNPDALDEVNETMIVTLSAPQNAVIAGASATSISRVSVG